MDFYLHHCDYTTIKATIGLKNGFILTMGKVSNSKNLFLNCSSSPSYIIAFLYVQVHKLTISSIITSLSTKGEETSNFKE